MEGEETKEHQRVNKVTSTYVICYLLIKGYSLIRYILRWLCFGHLIFIRNDRVADRILA